jgi:cytoskeleton protein RodZ
MTVGIYLREAREAAGYSVEDIATRTRIPATIIKDLESEKFESSGGNAYARGHIRTIAQVINADIDRLIAAFEDTAEQSHRPMIELLQENSATALRNRKNININFSPKIIGIATSIIAGIAIIIPTGLALSSSSAHKGTPVKPVKRVLAKAPLTKSSINPVAPTTTSATSAVGRVVVRAAHGTSWLYVGDAAGNQLFSGKLSNGASETFDPTNGLYMKIGNAGAVSVLVNGKDQGLLGAQGEVKSLTFAPAQTNG